MSSSPAYAKHPEHTITVKPFKGRVVVETKDGQPLVDTRSALSLKEANYPAVLYVPRADTQMAQLKRTAHSTHCPFKGDASYFSVGSEENAVWSYETPFDQVAEIKEALAFYPNKVVIKATAE
jgi:uncharacterized protein (DUF427 family)